MPKKRWAILVELLKDRPHRYGAEIGVFEGDTTEYVMKNLPGVEGLYCVDAWRHYPEQTVTLNPNKPKFYHANFNKVRKTFEMRMRPYQDRIVVLNMFSADAAHQVQDGVLDWAFIDANHAYDFIRKDIVVWLPKIKPGGLLMGHDYKVKGSQKNFGVTRAVREIFGENYGAIRYVWYHEVGPNSPDVSKLRAMRRSPEFRHIRARQG